MMRWGCNRRCRMQDSREWFTRILRSSISRRQEGRYSELSPAKKCEAFNRLVVRDDATEPLDLFNSPPLFLILSFSRKSYLEAFRKQVRISIFSPVFIEK